MELLAIMGEAADIGSSSPSASSVTPSDLSAQAELTAAAINDLCFLPVTITDDDDAGAASATARSRQRKGKGNAVATTAIAATTATAAASNEGGLYCDQKCGSGEHDDGNDDNDDPHGNGFSTHQSVHSQHYPLWLKVATEEKVQGLVEGTAARVAGGTKYPGKEWRERFFFIIILGKETRVVKSDHRLFAGCVCLRPLFSFSFYISFFYPFLSFLFFFSRIRVLSALFSPRLVRRSCGWFGHF